MSAAVNINRVRSSGTFQALARDPSISLPLQYLDVPASRLDLRFRRPREGVRSDGDGAPDLTFAEDLDELGLLPHQAGGSQLFRAYRITGDVPELAQVHGRIQRRACDRVPAARLSLEARQPALQWHLTALVGGVSLRSGTGARALVAAAARLTVSAPRAAPDALARLLRAGSTLELVQPHRASTSSTCTRWRTLWSMPRIWGVSSCTLESRMRLSPRARTVRLGSPFEPMTLFTWVTLRGLIA